MKEIIKEIYNDFLKLAIHKSEISDLEKVLKDYYKEEKKIRRKIITRFNKLNKVLNPRELKILQLRYKNKLTFEKIGKKFGVSRERIRQVETRALNKLIRLKEQL